ncbi:MAG: response regulator [Pseudomonadota bacterium]
MMRHTIRHKLLLLTLVPPLVLLVVILGYFIYQDNKLMHEALVERGETVSRYLASAAEYGVITGNTEQLLHISESVLQGDIVAFKVYDFDNKVIFTRGEVILARRGETEGALRGVCGGNEAHKLFCAPISLAAVPVSDFGDGDVIGSTISIGRIELTLSTHIIGQKRVTMLRWSLLLVLAVVVIAVLLSRRVGQQLVEPLSSLGHIVDQVRQGDLAVQVNEDASGELLALQQGVNIMIEAQANSRQHMEQEIDRATERLRNTMQELEQRNEELLVEQQRAESASLAKSQFLATMSHEIRTPLSGMIGMLQLLRDGSENRRQLDYVDSLESAAQSLRQLIDDILDFSRLEVGKLTIQNKPFAPLAVIEEVMVMLTPSAHHKGLEFVLDVDGGLPPEVVGDPLRFRQVLINLTANAIKFTGEGEVVVLVRPLTMQQSGSCQLRFEIRDSGIGIPEEKQALVFESFTQIDEGDARNYAGSGLGTTVSRELVEMMGGEIGLESKLGKGSCFWFELPWECTEKREGAPTHAVEVSALLLENHPSSAMAILGMLHSEGIGVQQVAGEQALWGALSTKKYEWVFIGENSSDSCNDSLLEKLSTQLPEGSRLCQLNYVNGIRTEGEHIEHLSKPLLLTALRKLLAAAGEENGSIGDVPAVRPLSVLLAEDDDINATVISHFLQKGGHRVVRVGGGEAALEQLRSNSFDCVLMDLRMPGLDGLEATRRWRVEAGGGRVPIIALTANASEEDRQRCSAAGMNDFLTKPVDSRALLDTLTRYCQ